MTPRNANKFYKRIYGCFRLFMSVQWCSKIKPFRKFHFQKFKVSFLIYTTFKSILLQHETEPLPPEIIYKKNFRGLLETRNHSNKEESST